MSTITQSPPRLSAKPRPLRKLNCLILKLEVPDIEKTKAIRAFLGLPENRSQPPERPRRQGPVR
jgi:hypothetical protein